VQLGSKRGISIVMAEVSDITFSGFKLRLEHEDGTFNVASLPNSYPPDPNAPATQLGVSFSAADTPSTADLEAKVGDQLDAGGVRNAKMLGIRLVGKFVSQYPDVVAG
jgi:hypothetical protein